MKKIYLFLFALFASWQVNAQVQVGTETGTTSTVPITSCWGFSYTQQIYTAAEINANGDITSISFNYVSGANAASTDWTIYLGHTSKTEFTSTTDWEVLSNLSQVYTGTVTYPAAGNLMTITFDTPFSYNGTDNLVVAVDENQSGYNCSVNWSKSDLGSNRSIYFRSDGTNPDPASPPTANGRLNLVANATFGGITQSCPALSGLTSSNISSSSATVSWDTPNNALANGFEYLLTLDGSLEPDDATTPTGYLPLTTTSQQFNGFLSPSTTYYIHVRAVCSSTEFSGWISSSFTTDCPSAMLDTVEEFTTYVPECWKEAQGGDLVTGPATVGTSTWGSDGFANVGTSGSAKYNLYQADKIEWLISRSYDIPTTGGYQLTFSGAMTDWNSTSLTDDIVNDYMEVLVQTEGSASWTVLYTMNATNPFTAAGADLSFDLSAYDGETVKFAFRVVEDAVDEGHDVDIFVDNFVVELIPTCFKPTDLEISSISSDSADISWTAPATAPADGYEYYVSTDETAPTASTTATGDVATGETTSLSTLDANTTYYVWVRSVCSSSDSSLWESGGSFTTLCEAFMAPFMEDFNDTTAGIPSCWTKDGTVTTAAYNWNSYATGSDGRGLRFDSYLATSGQIGELYSPMVDLTDVDMPELRFDFKNPTGGNFEVLISNDNGVTYVSLEDGLTGQSDWTEKIYDLSAYIGDVVMVQFKGTSNYGPSLAYIDLDNVSIANAPMLDDSVLQYPGDSMISTCDDFEVLAQAYEMGLTEAAGQAAGVEVWIGYSTTNDDPSAWTEWVAATYDMDASVNDQYMAMLSGLEAGTYYYATRFSLNGGPFTYGGYSNSGGGEWDGTSNMNGMLVVEATAAPTGEMDQVFIIDSGATIADLVVEGTDIVWYASEEDATNGENPLDATTLLENDVTYYATQSVDGCEGTSFAVTATLILSENTFDVTGLKYFPNPVSNQLTINYTKEISLVEVFNMIGQRVASVAPNANNASLDMSQLTSGNYLVQMTVDGQTKTLKVIKK